MMGPMTTYAAGGAGRTEPEDGGTSDAPVLSPRARRLLAFELVVVLLLTLGRSAIYSVVDLLESATAPGGLSEQTTTLNGSYAPGREWFELVYQLLNIAFTMVPVVLCGYLLVRSGVRLRKVWFKDAGWADLAWGALLAAGVGSLGLAFYLVMNALDLNLTVQASGLDGEPWWTVPVLVLQALKNAVLEEFIVLGYVIVRLRQLGWSDLRAIVAAAVLRGGYHLYQGLGGFFGNLAMGLFFGWLYRRWGRVTPLVVTHLLLDVGAFVGYTYLVGKVSWLPV